MYIKMPVEICPHSTLSSVLKIHIMAQYLEILYITI